MKITCSGCNKSYDIPEERIRKLGDHISFPCPACKAIIEVRLEPAAPPELPRDENLRKRILRTVSDLPPMPQVAQKARQLTADEEASFTDLARIIETDQAIAARVLKLANSSYYGQMGRVTSIQHASVVVGLKTLHELLTVACAGSLLGCELPGYGLSAGDLWGHSLAAANCARAIAEKRAPELADDAFAAGLIHDCGKLILSSYVAERQEAFARYVQGGNVSFLQAERSILGFDHAAIAAEVCAKWQIPRNITRAIDKHHEPSASGGDTLTYIIHAADAIALMSGIGAGSDGLLYQLDKSVVDQLALSEEDIGVFMADSADYVEKIRAAS